VTAGPAAAAVLAVAIVVLAAAPVSPGYPAYEKANALFVQKKLPEALAANEESLRLDPQLIPALTLKAKLAMAAYRLDTAGQALEKALAIDPRAPYAQFLYGLVAYLGNDMNAALPRFQKARRLNPTDPRAALYLALTTESLGQPAEAMSLYEEAVRLEHSRNQPSAETLLPGARLLFSLGRLAECERWISEAARLSPNSRDVHFERARLLLEKGDPERAVIEGETALGLPDGIVTDQAIRYLLVRAYQKNGRPDRAAFHAEIIRAQESAAGKGKE
jgi:tetratricopeptide (TPR) repeat protein